MYDEVFHVALDQKNTITLDWIVNYNNKEVVFEIHYPYEYGWFAVGFSNYGESFPADYCILWYDWKKRLKLQDTYVDSTGQMHLDAKQNCNNFQWKRKGNVVKFTFSRHFDTCDESDYVIEEGTTHIMWAKGRGPLYKVDGLNISSSNDRSNNGMVRVQLLKNLDTYLPLQRDVKTLEILAKNVEIPPVETTYWCHVHKLPNELKKKHHVVKYEPAIQIDSEGIVHHMEVFHCVAPASEDIPTYAGSCFDEKRPNGTQVCKRVLAAWAMGAKEFSYPKEAGLPIGGPDFNQYVMLEVHYNNPGLLKGNKAIVADIANATATAKA